MGDLKLARTVYKLGSVRVEVAEAMAINKALSWIKSLQWNGVVVESDCLVAVQAFRSKVAIVSPFGRIIAKCRQLAQEINTVNLFFVRRSANMGP